MPTTTSFANLITFSRGSNATVVGPNGLVQWAPSNLLTFSEQFDNAAWAKTASTVTANTAVAPDGTTTADTLAETAATSGHVVSGGATVTTATHVFSVYLKKGSGATAPNWVQLYTGGISSQYASFNLGTGTVGSVAAGSTATITNVGNGWYRCTLSFTPSSSGSLTTAIAFTNNTDATTRGPSYAGATTSDVFIWGAQLELGTAATTYNPTTVKNLLGFSEAFDNAAWTKLRASIVTGAAANPINGLFNAQKLMEDTTASNSHRVQQTCTISGAPITFSAYLKAGERTWAYLRLDDASSTKFAYFNLATGVTGSATSGLTSSVTAVGNGWYRCSTTFASPAATASGSAVIGAATGNTPDTYTGDGNSGIFIYGAQLSDSASLDPYVPTPGAAPSSTAYYGPRFDYDPVTLQPRGILIEGQRTNLLTYSEQFDNAAWTQNYVTVTANSATAPNGTATADLIIATAVSGNHQASQAATTTATATTYSIYAKQGGYSWCALGITDSGSTIRITYFNLATGVVGTTATGITAAIQNVGGGWYRCSVTVSTALAGSNTCRMYVTNADATLSFTGDGTSGIYLWGAQLEAGASATSYIPTIASTVTRSADVATITGQNFGQFYRQDEGCLVVDALRVSIADPDAISVSAYTDSNNTIETFVKNADSRLYAAVGGAIQVNLIDASKVTAGVPFKTAAAYRLNDYAMATSGGTVLTDTSATVPAAAVLGIGSRAGSLLFSGHIRSIHYIPVRAADFQLQALTT